jgi:hypothetical protein
MPRDYEVTLHFCGSHTFFISAPDEGEAVDIAHDELANLSGELEIDVVDSESHQVDGSCDE